MALQDRIALQAGALGIRTGLNAAEVLADYAGGLRQRRLRQESELLAKEELRSKGVPEGVYRKQFPHVPRAALPPSQFPHETSCQADHKRPSVSGVFLGVMEGHCKACEFCQEEDVSWTPERLAESLAGAGSVRLVLLSPPGEARWNVCFVTRESV
jgi:hypothetical protein